MSKTIVWIEDDIDIIDPVVEPLKYAGYRFVRLRTAAEALQAIQQIRDAELILLDMILPPGQTDRQFSHFPGSDVLQELREVHGITTPVVALTVVRNEEVLQQLKSLGVADIVHKPVRSSVLKSRVEKVLGIEVGP